MRNHGVASFPDPDSNGGIQIPSAIDTGSPAYQAAYRTCRTRVPHDVASEHQKTQMEQQLLAFAKCMRAHGLPTFPDPAATSGAMGFDLGAHHIDPNSPIFTHAQAACGEFPAKPTH